jgi:hypothetical protein
MSQEVCFLAQFCPHERVVLYDLPRGLSSAREELA